MRKLRLRLWILLGGMLAAMAAPSLYYAAQKLPQPIPSPNAPNQSYPPGLNGPDIKDPNAKTLDPQNQAEVKAEVEKLYALVFELREQMKQTDNKSVLSLNVVKRAQQIEKLAKDIKDRAKH